MMMVDTRNRWVYKGSVTTPPCATTVYWNVVRKVYPIKQEHFDLFKKQMERGSIPSNFREIQTIDDHDLHIIETMNTVELVGGLVVFALLFVVFACIAFVTYRKANTLYVKLAEHERKGHEIA